ncbi:unnamed protein product [Rhodiola kirilowii]
MESAAEPIPTRSTRSMTGKKPPPGQHSSKAAQKSLKSETLAGPMDPWSSKTPEKPMQQRGRNRGVALSVKDVRRVAKGLRESDPDQARLGSGIRSTKRQIFSSPERKSKSVDVDTVGSSSKLPEKYEMLCETFHSLDCVVRLMRMKGATPVFSNVCSKVEQLTDRRFTHGQLAQVKFILPEVMVLKKVSTLDEATSCMKNDIHISFDLDSIKADGKVKAGTGKLQLSKIFRARLLEFYKSHSKDSEIPEGPLPEPFGRPCEGSSLYTCDHASTQEVSEPVAEHLLEEKKTASHFSHSFKKRLSQRTGSQEEAQTNMSDQRVAKSRLSRCTFDVEIDDHVAPSQMQSSVEVPLCGSDTAFVAAPCSSSSSLLATPCKQTFSPVNRYSIEKTPSKHESISATPMTATPVPLTPRRSLMSPDDDSNKTSNKLVRRALRIRSLKFDTLNDVEAEDDIVKQASCSSIKSELVDILDEDLLQSIMEKEMKAREENDPAISQAKRRRDMIAGLPKLFNMVHFYFRSIKRSVVTKEELLHNMIASHSDFLDRREVEERLKLLQELAPEYITESVALSGDCLLRVNKASNAESIRARLAEAI